MGKLIASLIENLQHNQELKKEYNSLNSGFNKNFEVIKQITTQKLMTGKSLSKKEKNILRQCKENQTVLVHKQEVLEEKYSKIKAIIFFISFPLKFFAVILTVLISLLILISKVLSTYARLNLSDCGVYCGFFADKVPVSIGLQDIWMFALTQTPKVFGITTAKFIMLMTALLYVYFLVNLIIGFKYLGLIDFSRLFSLGNLKKCKIPLIKTTEIRSDKIISMIFYTLFFISGIAAIAEILHLNPAISFYMEHYSVCDVKLIDKEECKFSAYMLFNVKNSVNFSLGMIFILGFDLIATVLTAFFVVYLPLKALMNCIKKEEHKNRDSEEEEEYLICC